MKLRSKATTRRSSNPMIPLANGGLWKYEDDKDNFKRILIESEILDTLKKIIFIISYTLGKTNPSSIICTTVTNYKFTSH